MRSRLVSKQDIMNSETDESRILEYNWGANYDLRLVHYQFLHMTRNDCHAYEKSPHVSSEAELSRAPAAVKLLREVQAMTTRLPKTMLVQVPFEVPIWFSCPISRSPNFTFNRPKTRPGHVKLWPQYQPVLVRSGASAGSLSFTCCDQFNEVQDPQPLLVHLQVSVSAGSHRYTSITRFS